AVILVEALLHATAVAAGRRFLGRSADFRRNDRADATLVPSVLVVGFRIVARVGQRRGQLYAPQGLVQQRHKPVGIDRRPAPRNGSKEDVRAALERCFEFGIAGVADFLGFAVAFGTPAHIVMAAATTLQARGVEGR